MSHCLPIYMSAVSLSLSSIPPFLSLPMFHLGGIPPFSFNLTHKSPPVLTRPSHPLTIYLSIYPPILSKFSRTQEFTPTPTHTLTCVCEFHCTYVYMLVVSRFFPRQIEWTDVQMWVHSSNMEAITSSLGPITLDFGRHHWTSSVFIRPSSNRNPGLPTRPSSICPSYVPINYERHKATRVHSHIAHLAGSTSLRLVDCCLEFCR